MTSNTPTSLNGLRPLDDIQKAAQKRFEQALMNAGHHFHVHGEGNTTVPLWLYSISPTRGIRVITQVSIEGYRACTNPTTRPRQVGVSPVDALTSCISSFDKLSSNEERLESIPTLNQLLLEYACHTKTWEIMPPLNQVRGLHFLICDWVAPRNTRILKPMLVGSPDVLDESDLAEQVGRLVSMHTQRYPHEHPILA